MEFKDPTRDSLQTKASLGETELADIDTTINKWLNLQKILKESQSLEKIIEKQHLDNYDQMKKYIHDFYELKIKSRKIYEKIKFLKMNSEGNDNIYKKDKECFITEASGNYFGNGLEPMEKLIHIIREYYDYVPKIVSLIDNEDTKQEKESLAEFFCNQFYNNIFIPNPEQEELIICLFKLLEQEINKMNIADIDGFLDDSTFIGKFMTAFVGRQEINTFLVNLLNKVMSNIDKRNSNILDLSLNAMMKNIIKDLEEDNEKEKKNAIERLSLPVNNIYEKEPGRNENKMGGIKPIELILEKIPKTKINFKKHLELEDELFRENQAPANEFSTLYSEDIELDIKSSSKSDKNASWINSNYFHDLNKKFLYKTSKEISDPDINFFYKYLIYQLEEKYHDPNAFANSHFFLVLKQPYFSNYNDILAKIYLKNFLFIQEQVENIIQSLINKISTIPYSLRCICTIIDILIRKKYPKLPKYLRHSFIGIFLFDKCIFPILNLENTNILKTKIFSKAQINCLNCIISVISNANRCKLFDIYNDLEKTMFNYYLLEIIPILNQFYDKLVDVQLPNQLTEFINEKNSFKTNIFLFNSNDKDKKEETMDKKKQNYDYFKENIDEIIRIKTVCFNEKDILFILRLINKNIDLFKDLPEFRRFKLAMEQKEMKEEELEDILIEKKKTREEKKIDENNKGEGYYTFIYTEQNSQFSYKLKEFYKEERKKKKQKEEKSLLTRMKNSIKIILRRLNMLNKKEYSLLNFATSNEKFFQSINFTLVDFEDDEDYKVPLKWHSKFIINNKNLLEQEYIRNDYEKLYEEIYKEENDFLNYLKSLSPIINTREAMNLNCAKNAIEKMKFQKKNLEKTKKLEKVKIFIAQDKTEVCINLTDSRLSSAKTATKGKIKDNDNIKFDCFRVVPVKQCIHRSDNFLASFQGKKKKKINSHLKTVNEFINKITKPIGVIHETIFSYIIQDIMTGVPVHQMHTLFTQYKGILKQSLASNFSHLIEEENEQKEILENVEEYILKKIYKFVFPYEPLPEDLSFYDLTKSYDWIQAKDISVKDNIPLEAIQDSISYLLEMEERARSISEKIRCFNMILSNINKITEFYFDKDDKSSDAQTPIFNYIIIKAHPKRFISNIHYINCFTDGRNIPNINVFVKSCLAAVEFIGRISPEDFNLTSEEFLRRCKESENKFGKV